MKTKITFLKVTIGLALAIIMQSCSMTKSGDFSQRKYTKFHKGEMAATIKSSVNEKIPVELSAVTNTPATTMETSSKELAAYVNNTPSDPVTVSKESKSSKTNSIAEKLVNRSLIKFTKRMANNFASHGSMVSYNNDDQILLIILAILLPPLAVYLAKGIGTEFWIDLILTLLFWIPGIIYALIVIL